MKSSQLSNEEFLAAFESATIADFHHVDHIRAAWIYLRRLPFLAASERMAESLRRFATQHGARHNDHETITQAWMFLVWGALERDRQAAGGELSLSAEAGPEAPSDTERDDCTGDGFDPFAAAHPELLDMRALDRFYSSHLLATASARAGFLPPDRAPLPVPHLTDD